MATTTENGHAPVPNENTAPDAAPAEQKEQTEQTEQKEEEKTQTNGDIVTVFHDPDNFNVKHPLMHEWTLWFTKPPSGKVSSVLPVWFCLQTELTDLRRVITGMSCLRKLSLSALLRNSGVSMYVFPIYPRWPLYDELELTCLPEQHHSYLRTWPESRLPPFQEGHPSRMGGPAEQARWQVVLLV